MLSILCCLWLLLTQPPAVDAFSNEFGASVVAVSSHWQPSSTILHVAMDGGSDDAAAADSIGKATQKMVVTTSNQVVTASPATSDIKLPERSYMVDFDWQPIAAGVFRDDSRPIILFDGVCNLCNGGVNFAMDHDADAKFRYASLQGTVAQSLLLREGKHPTQTQTIVLVTPEKAYYASHAVAKICSKLDLPLLKLMGNVGQALPKQLREPIYKFVSRHRFVLGENDSCRLDLDGEYTNRFVSDPTVVVSSSSPSGSGDDNVDSA
jgi:predicted DCC family thiol-disulfide oxidoreductase YuxK